MNDLEKLAKEHGRFDIRIIKCRRYSLLNTPQHELASLLEVLKKLRAIGAQKLYAGICPEVIAASRNTRLPPSLGILIDLWPKSRSSRSYPIEVQGWIASASKQYDAVYECRADMDVHHYILAYRQLRSELLDFMINFLEVELNNYVARPIYTSDWAECKNLST